MLQYVKTLRQVAEQQEADNDAAGQHPLGQLKMTESGFPILPEANIWENAHKKDLENLVWAYLSKNYSKPTGWCVSAVFTYIILKSLHHLGTARCHLRL